MKCWVIAEFVEQIADIINRREIFAHDIGNSLLDIWEYLQNIPSLQSWGRSKVFGEEEPVCSRILEISQKIGLTAETPMSPLEAPMDPEQFTIKMIKYQNK